MLYICMFMKVKVKRCPVMLNAGQPVGLALREGSRLRILGARGWGFNPPPNPLTDHPWTVGELLSTAGQRDH